MSRSSLRQLRLEACGEGALRADVVDPQEHLAAAAAKPAIAVLNPVGFDKFLPGLELMVFPAVIVQVLVENHDRTRQQQIAKLFEHGAGRRIQIAVDVQQGNRRARMVGAKAGKRVLEPAFVYLNIGEQPGDLAAERELSARLGGAVPALRQALETVEGMQYRGLAAGADQPRDKIGARTLFDAEFEEKTPRRVRSWPRLADRRLQQPPSVGVHVG